MLRSYSLVFTQHAKLHRSIRQNCSAMLVPLSPDIPRRRGKSSSSENAALPKTKKFPRERTSLIGLDEMNVTATRRTSRESLDISRLNRTCNKILASRTDQLEEKDERRRSHGISALARMFAPRERPRSFRGSPVLRVRL